MTVADFFSLVPSVSKDIRIFCAFVHMDFTLFWMWRGNECMDMHST